jgi:hypothetical protein
MRGGRADRVPIILHGFECRSLEDLKQPEARQIGRRICDQIHYFHGCNSFVNRYLVTPPQRIKDVRRENRNGQVTVTTEIDTPKGKLTAVTCQNPISQTVWTVKYPVETLDDIEKIRSVPWEAPPQLAPPDLSKLGDSFETRGIVYANISSPFVCAAGMMPYQYFLELCATHLDLMKELTDTCRERILRILDVILSERTVEYVWMGGCEWLTPPMGSPRLYKELVQDFERPVIDSIHAGGAICHVHCHGNVRSTLELVIQRKADYFEPVEPPPDGDITFAEAKAAAGGRITLGGNVEFRILSNENADVVEQATREAFKGGKTRMVLQTSAGPISPLTPRMVENYNRMIDVWEELSPI